MDRSQRELDREITKLKQDEKKVRPPPALTIRPIDRVPKIGIVNIWYKSVE